MTWQVQVDLFLQYDGIWHWHPVYMAFERMTIDHFWDSMVTIGNLPIRKSGAMTSILQDAMKGMNDNHDES